MANSSGQPDSYGRVIGDAQQTVTLAGAAVELLRQPISSFFRRRSAAQTLEEHLGPWSEEARGLKDQRRTPVLKAQKFEDYLLSETGQFRPQGQCTANASWAHFLHALGIVPGKDIVDWKPLQEGWRRTNEDRIEMEVDGEVICHIINLYREAKFVWGRPRLFTRVEGTASLSFGELTFTDKAHVHFSPGILETIDSVRMPFGSVGAKMEPTLLMAAYYNAIQLGTSKPELVWPDATRPLAERAEKLVSNLKKVEETTEPLLLTCSWFDEASRIMRRIFTNGGKDRTFLKDVFANIDKDTDYGWDEEDKDYVKEDAERYFMFEKDHFQIGLIEVGGVRSRPWSHGKGKTFVLRTLEAYSKERPGSWKHTLSTLSTDLVSQVLRRGLSGKFNSNVRVLDFQSGESFWSKTMYFS
jgi:hypothetical protein